MSKIDPRSNNPAINAHSYNMPPPREFDKTAKLAERTLPSRTEEGHPKRFDASTANLDSTTTKTQREALRNLRFHAHRA